jgi:predicted ribosome quality control (RQC) complex YloA/Tae2 family protein
VSLDAREIEQVVAELAPLCGSRVESVRVHAERAITIDLRGSAGPVTVLLSAEPDLTRIHAVRTRPPAPEAPFAFQAPLRRELEGARLAGLSVGRGERVVELAFERPAGPVRLVAELTGRHGNLFLVGADGRIRAAAARGPAGSRRLAPGMAYLALAPREAEPVPTPARFTAEPGAPFPRSAAIERAYREREEVRALAEARRRLREPLRAGLARARRALEKLADEADRVPAAEADRRAADLLKQDLSKVRRGAREAVLTEWTAEGPREVRVSLDPALGPKENMERYYRRARRIAESAARVAARTDEVRAREAALRALVGAVEEATPADLPRLEREARRLGAGPRPPPRARRRRDEPLPPHRSFRSLSGVPIWVGRGAEENDALTLRLARGNDLWMHARGRAGAHVVVRLERGRAPDQETFLDAAHLAAHFSDGRGESQVEVASTRAKHVRKPRGAAPGAVTYSQEKVVLLRVEAARLERLLAEEEGTP